MPADDQAGRAGPPAWLSLWSFREDVYVEIEPADGSVILHSRWGDMAVRRPRPVVREVLRRMALGPILLENAMDDHAHDVTELARLHRLLDRLQHLVVRSIATDMGKSLFSVVPLTQQSRFRPKILLSGLPIRMSRFVFLRSNGQEYFLESPLSLHRVVIHRAETLGLVGGVGRSIDPDDVGERHSELPVAGMLSYLAAADMVVQATSGETAPQFAEDTDRALAAWAPLDLMFHTRSRLGRHDYDFGATYPLADRRPPEPVVKPPANGVSISLRRPTWERLLAADPPLTVALEGRRSIREYGQKPLTLPELGELLYRTARMRSLRDSPDPERPLATLSDRPYPSAGALYELEFYVTVNRCKDVSRGVYHYDPAGHRLELVNDDTAIVDEMLENGRLAANLPVLPPILITLTARFNRISWKYTGLTYALMLKHVGVVMQNLYLVGTAMGLASCALGSGDVQVSARAFGTDWRVESSVGEFLIGRNPDIPPDHVSGGHPMNDMAWGARAISLLGGQVRPSSRSTAVRDRDLGGRVGRNAGQPPQ